MPAALTEMQEAFAQLLAKGEKQIHAYKKAGFAHSTSAPSALAKNPKIVARINEIILQRAANQQHIEHLAIARAVEKTGISKERVINELAALGFANMIDYIDDRGIPDLTRLNRDTGAAVTQVEVHHYMDGSGEDAREVRRIKFKLADKRAALVDIGKELGMFINREEHGKPGDFANLTDEALRRDLLQMLVARGMTERQAIRFLDAREAPPIEGEAEDVTPSDITESDPPAK